MAREISELQSIALNAINTTPELSALEVLTESEQTITGATSTSKVAVWRLWIWVFCFCQWIQETLWDVFKADVEERIAQTRPHTKGWYRGKALDFHYGFPLVPDTDYYDLSTYTEDEIKAAKIITNADAVRVVLNGAGAIRIKAVRTVGGNLAPLDADQRTALFEYMDVVTDAGTPVLVTSTVGDDLKLKLDVYYDPLVLAADGSRLDGTDPSPVKTAINAYLKSIKFNGSLVLSYLEQELKSVSGVRIPVIKEARTKYAAFAYTDTADGVGLIDEIRAADAGYMTLDEAELVVNYIPYSE